MIVRARFREQEPVRGVAASNEARALAMAYAIELAVESGRYRSMAEVAGALGLSRSRLSQVMRWRWAPVADHDAVISGPPVAAGDALIPGWGWRATPAAATMVP